MKSIIALYLIFGFGILWHSIPATFDYVLFLTPFVLLIAYSLILYPEIAARNYRNIIWLLLVFVLTIIIEIAGVRTGKIFGEYNYGDTFRLKFFEVPVLIGLNWAMIIWGSSIISNKMKTALPVKIFIAALLAVGVDILIEPLSHTLDYWYWKNDIIPLQNYIAWFIISAVFSGFYYAIKPDKSTQLPMHFYITQILFFSVLNLTKG